MKSIVSRFLEVAQSNAQVSAVMRFTGTSWETVTYQSLYDEARLYASALSQLGVASGEAVIIPSLRTAGLIPKLLGILWVGGHYVFVDPKLPKQRQSWIVQSTGARFGFDLFALQVDGIAEVSVFGSLPEIFPVPVEQDSLAAYVMFTSGSTGVPKGVVVPHRAVHRLVVDSEFMTLKIKNTFLLHSALSFDAATLELWGPLLNGGTCVICPAECQLTPDNIGAIIKDSGVTNLWLTSSFFNLLVSENVVALRLIQQLLIGGEALSVPHVRRALASLPDTQIYNGYGPTENTTFTTVYPIPSELNEAVSSIPIGYPVTGTECEVFDKNLQVLPAGEEGELIAFGQGLALEYLGRDDLTQERFVEVTRADGMLERGYRTGDLVIQTKKNGCFHYIGRNDAQVKIDGNRIELGEIEACLHALDEIKDARVILRIGPEGQKRIAAYIVWHELLAVEPHALKESLSRQLPAYMLPHFWLDVDAMPLNSNGKLDVKALPDPYTSEPEIDQAVSETIVKECWHRILGRHVARDLNFLDAGGTSLEAIRLRSELVRVSQQSLSETFVFEFPTIGMQEGYFKRQKGAASIESEQVEKTCQDIAIVGMAGRFPGADDVESFWENLLQGKESITFFSDEDLSVEISQEERQSSHYVPAKGVLAGADQFDAAFFGISPLEADIMDPQQRVMLQVAWHALENAGMAPGAEGAEIGVFAGANWGRYYQKKVLSNQQARQRYGDFNAALVNEPDFLSTRISYKLNLRGPSVNIYTACSTGLVAIAQACSAIEQGQCHVALAGGVSVTTPLNAGYRYQEGGMLSKDGHCRTFDAAATGTTFNDGAGFVVLKRLDLAERDGDLIHAVVKGYAINNDGAVKASYTAPSVSGQVSVYRAALNKAQVAPQTIGFVETHGTATPLGDPIEVASLAQAYASESEEHSCAIGSVKSNIGHTIHAAGVASFIKATCAVRDGRVPPTLFFTQENPKLKLKETPFFVNTDTIDWPMKGQRRASVSSLGVGGTNAHIIIEQYTGEPDRSECVEQALPLCLSAKSPRALAQMCQQHADWLSQYTDVSAQDLCAHRLTMPVFPYRVALNTRDRADLCQALQTQAKNDSSRVADENLGFGILFTGQGSQRYGMARAWYESDAEYRSLFDRASKILVTEFELDLAAVQFGDDVAPTMIHETQYTQPVLFIFEVALARWLIKRAGQPQFLIGHSIGEYAAAVIAECISFDDALRIVACRGKLMQGMEGGSMLAVKAEWERFAPLMGGELDLAASNAPSLNVLSGSDDAIIAFEKVLKVNNISSTKLNTSHAFHSRMMEPMLEGFGEFVSQFKMLAPKIPIYSTATGKLLNESDVASSGYWISQVRQPVRYSEAITEALASTANSVALLEAGPGSTLASLAMMHDLPNLGFAKSLAPACLVAVEDSGEPDKALNEYWARGGTVDFTAGAVTHKRPPPVPMPLYPFDERRHWLEDSVSTANHAPQNIEHIMSQMASLKTLQQGDSQAVQTREVVMDKEQHMQSVKQKLIEVFEDVTGYDLADMEGATHFSEAGLDSLLLTQVATALVQSFGGDLTFRHLVEDYTCIDELVAFYVDVIPAETTTVVQEAMSGAPAANMSVPAMPANLNVVAGPSGNSVMDLVNAQLQVMQMQLAALGGAGTQAIAPALAQASVASDNLGDQAPASAQKPREQEEQSGKARSRHAPGAKITKESLGVELSVAQRDWVDQVLQRFQDKFAQSKAYAQEHREYFADPRTVSGFNPEWKEIVFQIVTKASKGSKLWDIDGNELIDITNGFGPILFGHSPDFVTEAVKQQIDKGIETGPQSPLAGEVAKLFCELTGNERCSFSSTGSEAVMGAVRLARTVTGRKAVVMFEGAYHGIFDEVITRPGKDYHALPAAPGIMREMTSNMLVLPWGDPEAIDVIRELGSSLAAVLVEPVQSRNPDFHDGSYIHQLRSVTKELDAALILDEVVTGFRVAPGGIRERFDVDADLATYGKVVGGGYPIGIIGGKAKFMDALDGGKWKFGDESIPEVGVTFFAGTFVRHPVSLAAAKAVMQQIQLRGQAMYDELEQKTSVMAQQALKIVEELSCEVKFEQFASLFYVSVPASAHWGHLFYTLMMNEGINIQQYRPSFLTTEHSDKDIDAILNALKQSLAKLIAHGLIEGDMLAAKKALQEKSEIPPGARLGKNAQGEPAYFIEDPEHKGQYIEVGKP